MTPERKPTALDKLILWYEEDATDGGCVLSNRDKKLLNAALRQRIADLHDEARNPPTLRTVCEPMLQVQRAYDTHIGPNESLIPKEPKHV